MNCILFHDTCHTAVRSEHFRALLYGGMRESAGGGEIVVPDVGYEVFLKVGPIYHSHMFSFILVNYKSLTNFTRNGVS